MYHKRLRTATATASATVGTLIKGQTDRQTDRWMNGRILRLTAAHLIGCAFNSSAVATASIYFSYSSEGMRCKSCVTDSLNISRDTLDSTLGGT